MKVRIERRDRGRMELERVAYFTVEAWKDDPSIRLPHVGELSQALAATIHFYTDTDDVERGFAETDRTTRVINIFRIEALPA